MHDELWAGPEIKVQYASFHYEEMHRSLQRRELTTMDVVQLSAGAIIGGNNWQRSLYPHFDAFLLAARSVPMIIETCFGADGGHPVTQLWLKNLAIRDPDELSRRKEFRKQFKPYHATFRDLPLTKVRDIVTHRGVAPIQARISGLFGVVYDAGPRQAIPMWETSRMDASTDEEHLLLRSQTRLPIEPGSGVFTVDGQPLFPLCVEYLNGAQTVLGEARRISEQVHGKNSLSPPPMDDDPCSRSLPI